MRLLSKFSIAILLPVAMVLLVALSVGITTFVSYKAESEALKEQVENTLVALREERRGRLEHEFHLTAAELSVTATRGATARAMTGFVRSWRILDGDPVKELQRIYITENPHPAGQKHELAWSGDSSTYSTIHAQAHPEFKAMLEAYGLYDIFLIDTEGNIVYTVFKESDFATNLNSGAYKTSGLAKAFQAAMKLEKGNVAFEDFSPYAPSGDAPAAFVAHPIFDRQGKRIGVVAFQVPEGPISAVASAPTGLGQTGEVYFLGADTQFRSNSRVEGDPARVGLRGVDNDVVQKALNGESGVADAIGDNGNPVVVAYSPVDVLGQTWAIIAEQDTDEVFASARELIKILITNGILIIVGVSVIALLFARSLVNPLGKVTRAMSLIAGKNYDAEVEGTARRDEIGDIAKSLEQFRLSLLEAREVAKESEFRGAAFNSSSAAIMMVGNNLDILHMNPSAMDLMHEHEAKFRELVPDFCADEIVGKCADIFHPPGLRERVRAILADDANLPYNVVIAVDGARLKLEINRVWGGDGEPIGFVVEWMDVSADFLNKALLESIDSNQMKAEFTPDGICSGANDLFQEKVGLHAQRENVSLEELLSSDQAEDLNVSELLQCVRNGESVFGRYSINTEAGQSIIVDGGFTPVADEKGVPLSIVLIANDVTDARREVEAAEAERAEMEAAQSQVVDALRDGLS
ncbi:cache domain-containing protein, partial [Aliiroseovarius crassostreae]|uniref:cache domain-containing protein n=1 Tax=Aliiroseovarius crassostreae TaxID=154981 RepID=UPI003C7DB679